MTNHREGDGVYVIRQVTDKQHQVIEATVLNVDRVAGLIRVQTRATREVLIVKAHQVFSTESRLYKALRARAIKSKTHGGDQ